MSAINRRDLLKYSLAGGGAALALRTGIAGQLGCDSCSTSGGVVAGSTLTSSSGLSSPPMRQWVDALPIAQDASEYSNGAAGYNPPFDVMETLGRDWWATNKAASYPLVNGLAHQRYNEFPAQRWYQIDVKDTLWKFHTDLVTPAPMFAYCGVNGPSIPGPIIRARYGEPIMVRINNLLSKNHFGVGVPETATHLHNLHSPCESDGFPGDFVTPGNYRDQHYPMIRAGYDQYGAGANGGGDFRESLGTLWYHDHRFNFTSQNVYKGLFGFFNAFDEYDCNDETGTLFPQTNLRLPSGKYDIMLAFNDPQFDNSGNIFFNVFDTDGHLGDRVAVNGKIWPFLNVERRKYRFRLLDAGPSRWYQFWLSKGLPKAGVNSWLPMAVIGNDGNLFENPVKLNSVMMGVANRYDVVIDFSQYNAGDTLYLVNRAEQISGRGPTYNVMDPGVPVLKFIVQGTTPAADPSMPWFSFANFPASGVSMRPLPRPTALELSTAVQRSFNFNRANGGWTVNSKLADISVPTVSPKQGTCEIWSITNSSASWSHPVHIHFEEFQILSRNGVPPAPYEVCRKDVLQLGPNETVRCFFRFRDFLGHYVMHCHNVVHEDHAMMIRWDIVK